MNLKELGNRLEIDEEECREFLALFKKTALAELTNLTQALKAQEISSVERIAHSIKGAAALLGLNEIHESAKRAERMAQMNRLDEIEADLQIIRDRIAKIEEVLEGRS